MPAHWARVLRTAATRFGLTPAETWALSLAEWRALTRPADTGAAMTAAELDALLHLFPDTSS